MKRTPMKRGGGFARPVMTDEQRQERREAGRVALLASAGRVATMGGATSGQAIDKDRASQSQPYQSAVRSIGYCMRCGCTLKVGEREFAHADYGGKGMGLKTDVRLGSVCCKACHYHVGTSGRLPKAMRRKVEAYLAWKTRTTLRKKGLWPKSLPDTWAEKDATNPPENPEKA